MAAKNKKQFGVWMDSHQATIIGRDESGEGDFKVLGHAKNSGAGSNSSENASNNLDKTLMAKFFKEITSYMQNVDELYITGTGTAQEQFISYLSETPQYKNVKAIESTSNKMNDDKLVTYISSHYN